MVKPLDRRRFVLTAAAVAGAGAIGAGMAPVREACAEAHARITAEFGRNAASLRNAASNIATLGRDLVCPYCGEPFIPT